MPDQAGLTTPPIAETPVPTPAITPTPASSGTDTTPTPSTAQTVNYRALDNPPHVSRLGLVVSLCGLVPLLIILVLGLSGNQTVFGASSIGGVFVIFVYGGFGALIAGFVLYASKQRQAHLIAFAQFLIDNNWAPSDETSFDNVATSLLGVGHNQEIHQAFVGIYRGLPLHGVVYRYITGSGKSQETHYFTDLCLELAQNFPLIVLDNKRNNVWRFSDLPERVPGGKTLQLEGDFNDSYRTTVLPGTEQEVLTLLTPDFMAELLQVPKQADIEIEGNKLFVITPVNSFKGPATHALFATADIVLKHLNELADSWQASDSPDAVSQMAATALTPRNNILLRPKHINILGYAGIFLYALFFVFRASSGAAGVGLIAVLLIIIVIFAVYQRRS